MSHADPKVRKYLGITLLPQAGVAIGMAQMVAASDLPQTLSAQVVTVALFATLVYELAGPVLTSLRLQKQVKFRLKISEKRKRQLLPSKALRMHRRHKPGEPESRNISDLILS